MSICQQYLIFIGDDVRHQRRLRVRLPAALSAAGHRAALSLAGALGQLGQHQPGHHLPPGEEVPAAVGLAQGSRQVLATADPPLGAEPSNRSTPHQFRQRPQEEWALRSR